MGKRKPTAAPAPEVNLFAEERRKPLQYRALILPRFLAEASRDQTVLKEAADRKAHEVIKLWADLEKKGALAQRTETQLDADFHNEILQTALGYRTVTSNAENYDLERQYTVPGVGKADGAIGDFGTKGTGKAFAVIELKGANVDLDRDKSNGRTAVQQCYDYLNALPDCPWGIVSNFVTTRLYHRSGSQTYQEFKLRDLRNPDRFAEFFYLFSAGAFLASAKFQKPRALELYLQTGARQKEVGVLLYKQYSDERLRLLGHLHIDKKIAWENCLFIAQRLLDRILFIAFCEDRDLLYKDSLKKTHETIPPVTRVTNPRWRNFVELFQSIDLGIPGDRYLDPGFNGGLFAEEPLIDNLQLDDSWTDFFKFIGTYDFRDEVQLEVLGELFERSIGDIEQARIAGPAIAQFVAPASAMGKSAERKRSGIYYTPPDFTAFLVRETLKPLIDETRAQLKAGRKLTETDSEKPSPAIADYWQACFDALGTLTVCDPACGSGAFLIQAYDYLYAEYEQVVEQLAKHTGKPENELLAPVSDSILTRNIFGVDLSKQSVEISQLALWIRSAVPGKKLADLSKNIVWGNSLVADPQVIRGPEPHQDDKFYPAALGWAEVFPTVFPKGFDAVVGNPPWERMKLQEREFFSLSAADIAQAVSAAKRRELIEGLEARNPVLHRHYLNEHAKTDRTLGYLRDCELYPLTAHGDINTYMLFAELAKRIVAPSGRVGLLVPSGIATDKTTSEYFAQLMDSERLAGIYDFENRLKVFPDVDGRFKFSALLFGGTERTFPAADFVFFASKIADLDEKKRHIALSKKDIALLNPNTRTCPIFRTRKDAKLTKAIYERVPILIDKNRDEGGNPWGITFSTMFHQTNDAELFQEPAKLKTDGFKLVGNRWVKGKETALPLYEAKMIQAYDHRAASVVIDEKNWFRQGQTESTSLVQHQNPEYSVFPRWWFLPSGDEDSSKPAPALFAFKNVTSPTNRRTMIASFIPFAGVINSAPLIRFEETISIRAQACLLANFNCYILDYIARNKIGNVNLNFFIIEQFAVFKPDKYAEKCPWAKKQTLEKWISERVLKLTCTANDMKPLAEAAGFAEGVHKWNPTERAELRAELDACYFHLYGIDRADVEYILGTFQGLADDDTEGFGANTEKAMILEKYDEMKGEPGV